MLTEAEKAIIVEFRRSARLLREDVLGCLRNIICRLTRRYTQIHGNPSSHDHKLVL